MYKIFEDFGIQIFSENGKYFIEFDSGELVSKMVEIEVSKEDAEKAQESEQSAYEVIIKYQNIEMFGNP